MRKYLVVMGLLALVSTPSWAADEEQNKKILKDALVGAITGAVAVEATKDETTTADAIQNAAGNTETEAKGPKKNFKKKKRDKKRPHGWDMGKKTGWGDSDVPPGLAKKEK